MESPASTVIDKKTAVEERPFTLRQRAALFFIKWVGYLAIQLIGVTLRFTWSCEDEGIEAARNVPEDAIVAPFWHRCVFPAAYFFRDRGIAVMTSRSFDGEYIARIIEQFGFKAVRGSSSRGALRALLGMHTVIEEGRIAAFTIDGPRGPMYVAKPGPVLLARNTGAAIRCFYVAPREAWVLKSWDQFLVPKPFTSVHISWSRKIFVPRDANSEDLQRYHAEMQAALERMRLDAEAKVLSQTG